MRYLASWPHIVLAVGTCVLAAMAATPAVRRGDVPRAVRVLSRVVLAGATLGVLEITLLGTTSPTGQVNLVPGASIAELFEEDYRNALENVAGNVLLFLPLGFFGFMGLWQRLRSITAAAATLSLLIEATQLVLGHRWVDIDDVLLNTLGGFLGALAARGFTSAAWRVRSRRRPGTRTG